jgi:energy-coupling factor transport system substrate-specific component
MVGVFAATAKVATLLTAMAGGGMNPIALMLKSCIFTTLLVVLLCRIRKRGTLMLFILVNLLAGLLLMGTSLSLLPPMLVGAVAAEAVMAACAGSAWAPYAGAAVYDLLYKILSLLLSYAFMRESPGLMLLVIPVVAVGWLGSLFGLYCGNRLIKELRHAGLAER